MLRGVRLFSFNGPCNVFYLACCRRNLVSSLPRDFPMVVDESVEVRMRKPDGDTKHKRQRLERFGPLAWRNTLRPMSLWIVLRMIRSKREGPLPTLYSSGGRVTYRSFLSLLVLQDRKLQILRVLAYLSRFPRSSKIFTQSYKAHWPVLCLARRRLVG